MNTPLRVVIADDHPVFLEGLQTIFEEDADFSVVATVPDGDAAIEAVRAHRPDLVLMDLRMPGTGGVEATAQITANYSGTTVLVLTMSEDDDSVFAALRAGARGYLLKEASADDIRRAARTVAHGEAIFGPRVANRVISFFSKLSTGQGPAPFPQLTNREREILNLVAAGCDNAAIARRLVLSDKTARNHVSAILTKLRAATRAEAVARARDAGLGGRGPAA
jgi:DNA-binding NarL/FixJ family response regulator